VTHRYCVSSRRCTDINDDSIIIIIIIEERQSDQHLTFFLLPVSDAKLKSMEVASAHIRIANQHKLL
jgi:hypothetical protein